jgi:hypothetical protein
MKRKALALVAAFAALAAVASASSRAPSVAVPQAIKAPEKEGRLLAVIPGSRGPVLGHADKRAVWIGRYSARLRVFNPVVAWAYASEGERLVIATETETGTNNPVSTSTIQFIHSFSVARYGLTKLGEGHVAALSWGDGYVNVVLQRWCCPESIEVVSIDPSSQKIRARTGLANSLLQAARVGSTLVLLVGPSTGLGTATLVVVGPDGGVRTVALDQIVAGHELPNEDESNPDFTKFRQNVPGLAVDPDNGRAFVVPAAGRVAEVSLGSLAVSYHNVAHPVSLFDRVHNWLEPKANAKGLNGPMRTARWLGSGVLAVTGADEAMFKDENGDPRMTWTPAGLTLIDTNSWGSKLIDRGADSFTVAGDTILATGSRWDSRDNASATGMGIAAYGMDGKRRLSLLRGRALSVALAFRSRAYLSGRNNEPLKVVDLAKAKLMKDRRAPIAELLVGDGST